MKLSIIVPVVRPQIHLDNLFDTLRSTCYGANDVELIVVNQSGTSIRSMCTDLPLPVREVMTQTVITAANARNLGALNADGEFLFFLDDDALLIAAPQDFRRLLGELTSALDAAVCHRGELVDGCYCSHWPKGVNLVTERNFSAFCIEWNIIVRSDLFFANGAFPEIGAGSQHAALSGEVFVFLARLLGAGFRLRMIDYVRVAHPSLMKPGNPASNLLGYFYGAGYSVGISIRYFSFPTKLYWLVRVAVATVYDCTYRFRAYNKSIQPAVQNLGAKLMRTRFTGFLDGLLDREIKKPNWLMSMV